MKKLTPAVGYLRMSSDQQDTSIDDQKAEIIRFAERQGFCIVRWYKDEGISGDTGARPDFQRLIKDVQTLRDFDAVLVWNQDRFSRLDILDATAYFKILRDADVRIVSIKDGEVSFSSMQGILMACINQHGAHDYVETLSSNVSRGFASAAMAGCWASGKAPDGYVAAEDTIGGKTRKRLVISEDRASIIHGIFHDYLTGDVSFREIASRLNARGLRNARGKAWTGQGVRKILQNEVYVGTIIRGKTLFGKYTRTVCGERVKVSRKLHYVSPKSGKLRARGVSQDRSACIVVPNAHPAIISQDVWDGVQRKMSGRRIEGRKPRENATIFAGLIFCGHCGSRVSTHGANRGSGGYLRCNDASPGRGGIGPEQCRCCYMAAEIKVAIIDDIATKRLSEDQIALYREIVSGELLNQRGKRDSSEVELRATIAGIRKKLEKAEARLLDLPDDMVATVVKQIRELRAQQAAAEIELSAVARLGSVTEDAIAADVGKYVAELRRLRRDIGNSNPLIARAAIASIVSRIEVFSEPITDRDGVHFNRRRRFSKLKIHYREAAAPAAPGELQAVLPNKYNHS